ncbi:MAG: protein archease [Planctomycetaceae bacterium]|nr:protein archease [Planctomycetaceae bacterium]
MFEIFDHTADLGLRVRADSLSELFNEAARGLFAQLVSNPLDVVPSHQREFVLQATDHPYLLVDWLNALLYAFETDQLLFRKFDVQVSATRLEGNAWGEPVDEARHQLANEVKAVTYHGLSIESCSQGWQAELILDI